MDSPEKKVLILTGPAGAGKTTLANYLIDHDHLARVITHTTRTPRAGEVDGVDYYFEQPDSFGQRDYLEQVHYAHAAYGSSWEGLQAAWQRSDWACIVLETEGALTYRKKLGAQAVLCYIRTTDPAVLRQRLISRGDAPLAIEKRLAAAEFQRDLTLPAALAGQAHIIINDNFQVACRAIEQLLHQE
ncbi:guanylate kinase [Leuconostocaceae bacterium ESL0958]|nr:guanylate kinase [Leuconostocaceae bacterium ESL0958]